MIPLEYFDEPIEWLKKSTYTQGGRIAVLGKLNTGELGIGGGSKRARSIQQTADRLYLFSIKA
jgi:hypothetical protein